VSEKSKEGFECDLCLDAGMLYPLVDGKVDYSTVIRCGCKKEEDEKKRQAQFLRLCNLPSRTDHKTFENFRTYGELILKEALRYVEELACGSEDVIFLTLLGESDKGKSHLGIAACRRRLERGEAACYVNVPAMLQDLRDGYDKDTAYSYSGRLALYKKVSLLVLDDLGTEKVSEWGAEQIQTVIDARYDNALHTIITTNRPLDDLFKFEENRRDSWREMANMRVLSRLERESWCKVIVLDCAEHMMRRKAEDYRPEKGEK